jgi:hypothetical protein
MHQQVLESFNVLLESFQKLHRPVLCTIVLSLSLSPARVASLGRNPCVGLCVCRFWKLFVLLTGKRAAVSFQIPSILGMVWIRVLFFYRYPIVPVCECHAASLTWSWALVLSIFCFVFDGDCVNVGHDGMSLICGEDFHVGCVSVLYVEKSCETELVSWSFGIVWEQLCLARLVICYRKKSYLFARLICFALCKQYISDAGSKRLGSFTSKKIVDGVATRIHARRREEKYSESHYMGDVDN